MKKYLLPIVLGITGSTALSSYSIYKSFSREEEDKKEKIEVIKEIREVPEETNSSAIVEFIFKTEEGRWEDKKCSEWQEGKVIYKKSEECKEFIRKTLGSDYEKHPNIWFRTDKENIDKVIKSYFPENYSVENISSNWFWLNKDNSLACVKESPEGTDKLEVSCYFLSTTFA